MFINIKNNFMHHCCDYYGKNEIKKKESEWVADLFSYKINLMSFILFHEESILDAI